MVSLRGQRAYLDANTVIYALEGFSEYRNLETGLLDLMDEGALVAVTSEITLVETIVGCRKSGDSNAERMFRTFLTPSESFSVVPITLAILEKVIELRVQFSLKIPDAIHIATGMATGCSVFVTRDAAWAKAGIRVVEPQDIA